MTGTSFHSYARAVLKNFWQAIEFSDQVTTEPATITCMGQDLVVYRTESGTPAVLNDLCVHRGAALSKGWVSGDCVVCPYHGWEYETDGSCSKIPANPKEDIKIPKKARTDSYPVIERYGLLWTFLGDLPEAERPPMPEWPEFEDPAYRAVSGEFLWNANYERILENGCDLAHAPFVHAGSFGNPNMPQVPDHEVVETEWSASATVDLEPNPPKGIWGLIGRGKERPPITTTVSFYLPNLIQLKVRLPIGELIIYDVNIPIDDTHTLTKWIALRTFFPKAWADRDARRRVHEIFLQDQRTVESVRPELIPFDLVSELHTKSDGMSLAYRRLREKYLAKGWGIEADKIHTPRREATVIPSPARRENPELANAWVLKAKESELS